MRIAQSLAELIGGTPLVRLNSLSRGLSATIVAKLESCNPGGSVKDRIGASMIETALADGRITTGSLIVEPTSGNTGIGLALICAIKGMKLVLTMPESMSVERRKLLAGYGATLVLTPAAEGMTGAIKKAAELVAATPGAYMPMQFENAANPAAHRSGTAVEIWDDTRITKVPRPMIRWSTLEMRCSFGLRKIKRSSTRAPIHARRTFESSRRFIPLIISRGSLLLNRKIIRRMAKEVMART